ncbi:hypothetical protein ZEAMMB73_Zm00001d027834 [Zea mays]|uniref:Dilute domain-containing protein n=1 Tax=Zea mays TaxID=4577 RepID=A0A1D6JQ02_MAIZE|nr:hypothetical protein ZEAMMB73_Zm00001d027834 [Zea mays]
MNVTFSTRTSCRSNLILPFLLWWDQSDTKWPRTADDDDDMATIAALRLTFWLSNTVVLREIIVQTFGISHQFTPSMMNLSMNGGAKKLDGKSMTMLWRNSYNGMQAKFAARQMPDDWQETSTLLATLEKIESWIFSRIVETIWWQVMEQCVARLNVAMFNAILRESSSEIPTDSISDPIVDPKVLPIPVGDLSFGSGAQLKNSVRA